MPADANDLRQISRAVAGDYQLTLEPAEGPLYLRLKRALETAIVEGRFKGGDALPSERDLAMQTSLSRVTVRKAIQSLVNEGALLQRHGSGTFVADQRPRVQQSLSLLTSFSEDMARRSMPVRSEWLERGVFAANAEEIALLGLVEGDRVSRISRLRLTGDVPLAIERASLSAQLLPDPNAIATSLYELLETAGNRPVRATQRIRAQNIGELDAAILDVPTGAAGLHIERISYLADGKVVELTRSIYRGDTYDFVAELRLRAPGEVEEMRLRAPGEVEEIKQ